MKNRKINKVLQFIIENNDLLNERIDTVLKELDKPKNNNDVEMSLDYIPSWLTGARTLLEKINLCVEKIEEHNADVITFLTELDKKQNISSLNNDVENLGFSKVVANSTGTGTTDLSKLEVDGVVYNIPSGGGGTGSLYLHKLTITDEYGTLCYLNFLSNNSEVINSLTRLGNRKTEISRGLVFYAACAFYPGVYNNDTIISSHFEYYLEPPSGVPDPSFEPYIYMFGISTSQRHSGSIDFVPDDVSDNVFQLL